MPAERLWIPVCLLMLAGFAACAGCVFLDPDGRSTEQIRAELLEATPLGSTEQEVDRYAQAHFQVDYTFRWAEGKGGSTLTARKGCHIMLEQFPRKECVEASWEFDKDGRLKDIKVSRITDQAFCRSMVAFRT